MQDLEDRLKELGDRVSRHAPSELRPTARALRRIRVGRAIRSGAVLATVAALVIGGFAGARSLTSDEAAPVRPAGPRPAPVASPSPVTQPSFTERFDSPLHGLSIGYPSGWRTRAATEPWGHDEVAFGAPDVDVIFDPTLQADLYFALVSEPLDGQPWKDWCCGPLNESTGICATATGGGGGSTTLNGNPAWIEGCGNDVAGDHVVFVATATRGYIIQLHVGDERLLQATYDGDWFEAALETLDLRPEDALDALNPSESP
jgi:hypothetical protein